MTTAGVSRYIPPDRWAIYDRDAALDLLMAARVAAGALRQLPYLRQWISDLNELQLRREVEGTTRIEGANFSEQELDEALSGAGRGAGLRHSQRQARAAAAAYRWINAQPASQPVDASFILQVHRLVVTDCDDDHCEPGAYRQAGSNVVFGEPRCRGAEGGDDCAAALDALCRAVAAELRLQDPIIRALAVHYHLTAIHPFGDGNGRTARAVEAFLLKQAGINDTILVGLSNYYYANREDYFASLYESRRQRHNFTPFLRFALPGVAEQCNLVAGEIITNHKRILFRELARSLFGKLRSPRRRVLAERQLHIIDVLLEYDAISVLKLLDRTARHYANLRHPERAQVRDIINLSDLRAIDIGDNGIGVSANLDWPQQFSESELLARYERMPAAVSANHPAMAALAQLLGRRR